MQFFNPLDVVAFCAGFAAFLAGAVVKDLVAASLLFALVATDAAAVLAFEDDPPTFTAAVRCFTGTRHD